MEKFDLIVIDTGPSALRGCNPKKVYSNAGDLIERLRAGEKKLAKFESPQIDWAQVLAHVYQKKLRRFFI